MKIINEAIEEYLWEDVVDEDFFLLEDLATIAINHTPYFLENRYTKKVSYNQARNYSSKFFETISKDYRDAFEAVLSSGSITVYPRTRVKEKLSFVTIEENKRVGYIYLTGTLEDSYTLSHEFMHYQNIDSDRTFGWHMLTEAVSILTETLQEDFLKKNYPNMPDVKKNKIDTYRAVYIYALRMRFELFLIQFYRSHGYIDFSCAYDLFRDASELEARIYENTISDIVSNKTLSIPTYQRNVCGGILAAHMHQRILEKHSRISDLIFLNENIGYMDFDDILRYLDLDLEDASTLLLTEESKKVLEKNYVREVKQIF